MPSIASESRRGFLRKIMGIRLVQRLNASGSAGHNSEQKARIREERCIAWKGGGCLTCRERCPEKAITWNRMRAPIVLKEACNGCGECVRVCPVTPCAIECNPEA